ncbi:hypothetical protein M0805_005145 [Coniferiporia weirii]|nr:hypothetical protein M0805_005145 [Coniferiporia weirii]
MQKRHPFASVTASPFPYDISQDPVRLERSLLSGKISSPVPTRHPHPHIHSNGDVRKVTYQQLRRRPSHKVVLRESGITLTLNGQEEYARVIAYGRGGIIDGIVSLANPANVTKVEAKMEGHVTVHELAGCGSVQTAVLSELLVYWDSSDRFAEHDGKLSSALTSPPTGTCPAKFSFKTVLPTHYTEIDGKPTPLPPSFCEALPGIPGFRSRVSYTISVIVTRVRDMKFKPLAALWKKKVVLRMPFAYRPQTCPPVSTPFETRKSERMASLPLRFYSAINQTSPFAESVKTVLYLPNSQITPLSAPIQFLFKMVGPEEIISLFHGPLPPSFLPKAASDSLASLASSLHQHIAGHLQHTSLVRSRSSSGTPNGPRPSSSGRTSRTSREGIFTGSRRLKIRVALVREINVNVCPYERELDARSGQFCPLESDGRRSNSQMHKITVLGEGVMCTTRAVRNSVTWLGEIRIDPRLGITCSGFETACLAVRDLLVVSLDQPSLETQPLQAFRQVIPMQLTTGVSA